MGGEVLGLIHHHVLAGNRAAADVADCLHLEQSHALQVVPITPRRPVPGPCWTGAALGLLIAAEQKIEVVDDRLHPGPHLFLEIPGQEADLLAQGDHWPGHQQPLVDPFIGHLVETGRQGEQRLARARLAHQGDQLNRGIQQQIQGEALLAVARLDPAQLGLGRMLQRLQAGGGAIEAGQQRVGWLGLVDQGHSLIGLKGRGQAEAIELQSRRQLHPVHLLGAHPQLTEAGVEIGDVHPIAGVVLGDQAHRIGLDAQVGVLRHQHHRRLVADYGAELLLLQSNSQDVVVTIARLQFRRQGGQRLAAAEHHHQRAPLVAIGNPFGQVALRPQLIQKPRHLAGVATLLRRVALEAVDLLDHLDRDHDVVVLETGEGQRIVQQHVGVQHERLAHGPSRSLWGGP